MNNRIKEAVTPNLRIRREVDSKGRFQRWKKKQYIRIEVIRIVCRHKMSLIRNSLFTAWKK
jgi:hypothetical protein